MGRSKEIDIFLMHVGKVFDILFGISNLPAVRARRIWRRRRVAAGRVNKSRRGNIRRKRNTTTK